MNDERFDDLLQEMRDESAPRAQVDEARERVWQHLQESHSLACDELRPALADYARGRSSESRRLLVEDHLSRCVACRHALADARGEHKVTTMPQVPASRLPAWTRWAVAASVVFATLYIGRAPLDSAFAPSGPRATVVSVAGTLYQPSGLEVTTGAELGNGEVVRTAAGSRAVLRLRDGSEIELNERTELAVDAAFSGDTVRLARGDIIIEAAEQGRGRLRVVTRDSIAVVKGTIFAVSSGTAGSLVSVVEGSVAVSRSGLDELLSAGQQAATSPALAEVGTAAAISWSQEASSYYSLLAEFAAIEEQLASSGPAMRRDATLLGYLPANASAYVAIPNLDGTIADAIRLLDRRAPGSAALNEWWTSASGRAMRESLEHLQEVTALLGDEMVLVLTGSEEPIPLFLATVRPGSHEELQRVIASITTEAGDAPPLTITEDLLLTSDSPANLALLSAQLGAGAGSPFAAEIRNHYQRGIGWMAAVDVAVFNGALGEDELARLLGLTSMRYLFVEQRSGAAGDESEATLSFSGEREGIASWIANAGGIGSAEYVSASAMAASAGSTRDPGEAFDQIFGLLGTDSELARGLDEFESETGISVRDDIAASLGTDFVIAIEGMALGQPQWVVAAEVVNPGALDQAVRNLVTRISQEIPEASVKPTFTIETDGSREWRTLHFGDNPDAPPTEALTWTYDRGYMVVSSDRGMVQRAITVRESASSLVRSSRFQQQFPSGSGVHSSGFTWLDIGRFDEVLTALGLETAGLGENIDPVLIVVTGENDSIRWATRSRLTRLIFDLLLFGRPA